MKKNQKKETSKAGLGRTRKIFLGLIVIFVGAGSLLFFDGHIPISTLRITVLPELKDQIQQICGGQYQIYPPTVYNWRNRPFPLYSPDGQYYSDVVDDRIRKAEKLRIFLSSTNKLIGTYSYLRLTVHCWDKDSSGVFVSDYDPGNSTLFIPFSRGGRIGPVKKLLVP